MRIFFLSSELLVENKEFILLSYLNTIKIKYRCAFSKLPLFVMISGIYIHTFLRPHFHFILGVEVFKEKKLKIIFVL